jgi:hypothetical protein
VIVKKLLLTCDQVFDALTRGPFPTGHADDDAVESHLLACHECRRLAEALRPAVALMHEAGGDETDDLPRYQGSLPESSPRPLYRLLESADANSLPPVQSCQRSTPHAISGDHLRLIAASLLVFVLVAGVSGLLQSPLPRGDAQLASRELATGMAGGESHRYEQALVKLASLKLPATCLPLTHRPASAAQAAEIALAVADGSLDALHCCTECHHAGAQRVNAVQFVAASQQACRACHRS